MSWQCQYYYLIALLTQSAAQIITLKETVFLALKRSNSSTERSLVISDCPSPLERQPIVDSMKVGISFGDICVAGR